MRGSSGKCTATLLVSLLAALVAAPRAGAQENGEVVVRGTVYNRAENKPVDFAMVGVREARRKVYTGKDGSYAITLPAAGTWTFIVRSEGLKTQVERIAVPGSVTRDFHLSSFTLKGGTFVIKDERKIQKLSRQTITARDIKEVPATFGDSVNALTTLPGVIRSGGFFGTLVIRGVESSFNRYYLDDIPLYNPQHFFGIHTVIANDLISEIDLYQSAFPARFGGAAGAVIQINSIDEAQALGGDVDISILAAGLMVKSPLVPAGKGDAAAGKKRRSYIAVAGRIGYLPLIVPYIYQLVTGDKLFGLPQYWDYQLKIVHYFNNSHSLGFLAIGNRDNIDFVNNNDLPGGFDPIFKQFTFRNELLSFTQELWYDYQPSDTFANRLIFFASFNDYSNYIDVPDPRAASWLKGYYIKSRPFIYCLKDKVRFNWLKGRGELNAGVEYQLYEFLTGGTTLVPLNYAGNGIPDFSDDNAFTAVPLGDRIVNHTFSAYLENTFRVAGLTVTPGVRTDYLGRSNTATVDPRGHLGYEFSTGTTIEAAGGIYSSFYQTNPYLFNSSPNYAETGGSLKPLRAAQASAGVEQRVSLVTIKAEGFYGYFWNIAREDPAAAGKISTSGRLRNYGAELMVRLDRREGERGFFGWCNYSFTQSKTKSGRSNDPAGDRWINYGAEMEHVLKLVAGYMISAHSISARFQLNSSLPYTPIESSTSYGNRYIPQYGGNPNSRHFPVDHRLDLRYTYTSRHEWGYVSFYVEVINVYNYKPYSSEKWDYEREFHKGSNPRLSRQSSIGFTPNFGVEAKF